MGTWFDRLPRAARIAVTGALMFVAIFGVMQLQAFDSGGSFSASALIVRAGFSAAIGLAGGVASFFGAGLSGGGGVDSFLGGGGVASFLGGSGLGGVASFLGGGASFPARQSMTTCRISWVVPLKVRWRYGSKCWNRSDRWDGIPSALSAVNFTQLPLV